MKIDTILFDLDGTLVDTNDLILESFKHTLKHFFPTKKHEIDLMPFVGEPLIDSFKRLDEDRALDMVDMYRIHNAKHHDLLVKEFDGVYETVLELHQLGLSLAIVTNKVRDVALRGLEMTRLDQFFDTVIAFDDVKQAKPHPEPLKKAIDLLDAHPKNTLMVGDSQFDIQAGKNAGTFTVGVSWSLKGKEFIKQQQPDFIVDHMSEIIDIVGVKAK